MHPHSGLNVAIIPAAGHSRRMQGAHKLLLPFRGTSIIEHLLHAWSASQVDRIGIVVRRDDVALQATCRAWSQVDLILPDTDPPDMRHSVQSGIEYFTEIFRATLFRVTLQGSDARGGKEPRLLIAPADLPTLNSRLIDAVIDHSRHSNSIVVPRFAGRTGHPISIPWSLAGHINSLPDNVGINQLLASQPVDYFDVNDMICPKDVDTPLDYENLR